MIMLIVLDRVFLMQFNIISPETLVRGRPYVIIGIALLLSLTVFAFGLV